MTDIARLDDAARADITEAGNLAFLSLRDRAIAAAEQDLRLNTIAPIVQELIPLYYLLRRVP